MVVFSFISPFKLSLFSLPPLCISHFPLLIVTDTYLMAVEASDTGIWLLFANISTPEQWVRMPYPVVYLAAFYDVADNSSHPPSINSLKSPSIIPKRYSPYPGSSAPSDSYSGEGMIYAGESFYIVYHFIFLFLFLFA